METRTAARIIELNREFYQSFAANFSMTRQRLQPGVSRILETIPMDCAVLDLGSGNGNLADALIRRSFRGRYIGLDFSPGFIEESINRLANYPNIHFALADFSEPGWAVAARQLLEELGISTVNCIFAFAMLHHIPGEELRLNLLARARTLLADDGLMAVSVWQFLNSPRLRSRIISWQVAGIDEHGLDEGDYLLDWRQGGIGRRYVHHFSPEELHNLAVRSGFRVEDTFISDGEGRKLGYYQIWQNDPEFV